MKTVSDLGAAKLHADEQDVIRQAADAFLFTDRVNDEMRDALIDLEELGERLVAADRLSPEGVELLIRQLRSDPHALETVHVSIITWPDRARYPPPLNSLRSQIRRRHDTRSRGATRRSLGCIPTRAQPLLVGLPPGRVKQR